MKNKTVSPKEENLAEWMLAKHNCNDCCARVCVLSYRENIETSLWQCTRCKTVIIKVREVIL